MYRIKCLLIVSLLISSSFFVIPVMAEESEDNNTLDSTALVLQSKSAILMEPSSGKIIYEKNSNEILKPASVTKIMTLLLIFDAIDEGKFSLDDEVVVSEYASSMGGSQVYLEPNEIQTVETMIKCIAIASANDAAVAMSEFVSGSHEGFVQKMNERAAELGMENTNFVNCSGLDNDNHYTTAHDIALMSRELITKYPEIFEYTTVWMDTITHKTKKGETEFGLTNTNKLIKWYEGATGLKTGSTSQALYCLSGTAERDGMQLIGVVMAAPDYKTRFYEVMKMFDYGFANCSVYEDIIADEVIGTVEIKKGKKDSTFCIAKENFNYVFTGEEVVEDVTKEIVMEEKITAPISKGDKVGEILYRIGSKELGSVDIITTEDVEESTFGFDMLKILKMYF